MDGVCKRDDDENVIEFLLVLLHLSCICRIHVVVDTANIFVGVLLCFFFLYDCWWDGILYIYM